MLQHTDVAQIFGFFVSFYQSSALHLHCLFFPHNFGFLKQIEVAFMFSSQSRPLILSTSWNKHYLL